MLASEASSSVLTAKGWSAASVHLGMGVCEWTLLSCPLASQSHVTWTPAPGSHTFSCCGGIVRAREIEAHLPKGFCSRLAPVCR